MELALAIQYPKDLIAEKGFAMPMKLITEATTGLPEVVNISIGVSQKAETSVTLLRENGYLGEVILTLPDLMNSIISIKVCHGPFIYIASVYIELRENAMMNREIIIKGQNFKAPASLFRNTKHVCLVGDGIELDEEEGSTSYENQLLRLECNLASNFTLPPLYCTVNDCGTKTGLQAFYGKMSLGGGHIGAVEDANVRLFQPVTTRFGTTENTMNLAKEVTQFFGRRHCIFRFTAVSELELMFNRPHYKPYKLSINGEPQNISNDLASAHFRFNFDQHISSGTNYVEVGFSIGNSQYHIDFVGGYHVGKGLILHSTNHPELGEIVLINPSYSGTIALNIIGATLKKTVASWQFLRGKQVCNNLDYQQLNAVVDVTLPN